MWLPRRYLIEGRGKARIDEKKERGGGGVRQLVADPKKKKREANNAPLLQGKERREVRHLWTGKRGGILLNIRR